MAVDSFYLLILGMWGVTFIPRWMPVFLLSRISLPKWFVEWLDLIPVSLLSAILLPSLVQSGNADGLHFGIKFVVAIPTFLIACVSRSMVGTILGGMFLYWLAGR